MIGSLLLMAFLMGLTGSLHCVGMCGPIIWVMPFQFMSGLRKWGSILLYHLGRISVYAVLAMTLYSFKSVFEPRVQQVVSIILGIVLLVIGIFSFIPTGRLKLVLPWTSFVRKHLGHFIGDPSPGKLFIAGMLNGLLPCGLVYMALSAAVVSNSLAGSILAMYAFGIGTMPMLIGITILKSRVAFLQFGHFKRLVPVAMFIFGSLFILRGMNLGISYFSPKVEVTQQHNIKADCCHKK